MRGRERDSGQNRWIERRERERERGRTRARKRE